MGESEDTGVGERERVSEDTEVGERRVRIQVWGE